MVYWMGRTRGFLAMGMLAAVLLGGCSSMGEGPTLPASSTTQPVGEETEEETEAQELQKQIMAILNLRYDQGDRMTSDPDLEQAAAFFLTYVLQDLENNLTGDQLYSDLDGMLADRYTYALVYDGSLSAIEAGKKILEDLNELDIEVGMGYMEIQSIAIAYGQEGGTSAWLVLARYAMDEMDTEPNNLNETEKPEEPASDGQEDSGAEGTPEI